jgi:hypothetical protein
VQRVLDLAVEAVRRPSAAALNKIETLSRQVRKLAEELMSQVAAGLQVTDPKGLNTVRQQTTFVDGLRQIVSLARRIARAELGPGSIQNSDAKSEKNPNE